jgi:hypothetical protein
MKTLTILAISLMFTGLVLTGVCWAGQKYNPFSGHWETTSPDAEIQYNPFEREFTYEKPGSQLEFNPFENKFEYSPPAGKNKRDGFYNN